MRHLTTRLVILLMAAITLITAAFDYTRLLHERQRLLTLTRDDKRVFAESLALAVSRNVRQGRTSDELHVLLDEILARPGPIGVAIYDPVGRVVAQTMAPGAPVPAADATLRTLLAHAEPAWALADSPAGQVLRYLQPVRWPGEETVALEARQGLARMEIQLHRAIRESILSRVAFLALFVLSAIAPTRWSIDRPIRTSIDAARAVRRSDLDQRIHLQRHDEIGALAEEFNRMATGVQEARAALQWEAKKRFRLAQHTQQE